MSNAKNRRRLNQWERYHTRYPRSGPLNAGGGLRMHKAHVGLHIKVAYQGRPAPGGLRQPWMLSWRVKAS